MTSSLQELYDAFLRPLNLTWTLDHNTRRRIMVASAVPALIVAAQLIQVALGYAFSPDELYGYGADPGELWVRLNRAAGLTVETLLPVAIGVLFLGGISRRSRAEGSWMFVFGAGLAVVATVFGMLSTFLYTVTEDFVFLSDIGVDLWPDMARTFGFLSIGFFFVAYRGLSSVPAEPPISDL